MRLVSPHFDFKFYEWFFSRFRDLIMSILNRLRIIQLLISLDDAQSSGCEMPMPIHKSLMRLNLRANRNSLPLLSRLSLMMHADALISLNG